MAHLQISTSTTLPMFFNISANVGRNSPNQQEDVTLVGFLFTKWAGIIQTPEVSAAAAKTNIGVYNAAFQDLIDAFQRDMRKVSSGTKLDGHVSRATPGASYGRGHTGFLITIANWFVATEFSDKWPRIDLLPGCPPAMQLLVKRTMLPMRA